MISKSESHKWELPGEMADYVNHQFECFIPEKDVEENLLVLQPVPENVRGVKSFLRFCKVHYGAEHTNSKPGRNHGKIPTENFRCSRAPS